MHEPGRLKLAAPRLRRWGLGLLVALLVVSLVFVVVRSGPLAPTRITVHMAERAAARQDMRRMDAERSGLRQQRNNLPDSKRS